MGYKVSREEFETKDINSNVKDSTKPISLLAPKTGPESSYGLNSYGLLAPKTGPESSYGLDSYGLLAPKTGPKSSHGLDSYGLLAPNTGPESPVHIPARPNAIV